LDVRKLLGRVRDETTRQRGREVFNVGVVALAAAFSAECRKCPGPETSYCLGNRVLQLLRPSPPGEWGPRWPRSRPGPATAGFRVRYFAPADLVETLYRGLADNSVGRVIDNLLRTVLVICDELGFAPLDANGSQLLFRFVAAAYERRSLGLASHWPFKEWGRFLPDHATTVSMLDRLLHHAAVVVTEGESFRMREAKTRGGLPPGARPRHEPHEEAPAED